MSGQSSLSLRAYADHRGCALSTVQEAIASKRLKKSVTRDGRIKSAELADAEWLANTRSNYVPLTGPAAKGKKPQGEEVSLGEARARLDLAKAELAELDLAERRKELLPAADVEARLVNVFTGCKTKLLGIPSRARQADPTLTAAQLATLESLIREACEDLATPEAA